MNCKKRLIGPLFLLLALLPPAGGFADSRFPLPDAPLLEAIRKDDAPGVQSLLEAPGGRELVNRQGARGDRPLATAARRGNLAIVKLLVENGAAVDGGREEGERTPLLEAAWQGHADVVQYLIAKGADVNAGGKGLTPLLAACAQSSIPIGPPGNKAKTIRILLKNGADVNAADESWLKTGRTPLMCAVLHGDPALVQALLACGARQDMKNKDGDTALALARKKGLEYIAQLLEKAASGVLPSPPVDAATDPLFQAVKKGRLKDVKALVAGGADVNLRDTSGSTPLLHAADGNSPAMVRLLLRLGADVNAKNGSNNTALLYAALKGHERAAAELLKNKADANARNMAGQDALIFAATGGKTKMVGALLASGARTDNTYGEGKTALLAAASGGHSGVAQLLLAHRADVNAADDSGRTALIIACEKGEAGLAEALLQAGADVRHKSKDGDTALHKAIAAKNIRMVKMLARHGGDFDRREALGRAVIAGYLETVKLLYTKDADINARGFAGTTLLMLAADEDLELVRFLVARGADVTLADDEGNTALMKAVMSFKKTGPATIKFLAAHGADVNAVNKDGETALILAVKKDDVQAVRTLIGLESALGTRDREGKSAWTHAFERGKTDLVSLLEKAGAARDYLGMEWKGHVSRQKEAFIKIVETKEEWSNVWRRALEKPAPDVDFENYVVASVFLGHSAPWLYSIGFAGPRQRGERWVISYALHDVMLRLTGPFQAGGQYAMKVFEKKKGAEMILEEAGSTSGSRRRR